jgi:UDP-N-acetylglucosamine acyltransferase
MVAKWTTIGRDNHLYQNVAIAHPPQDVRYKGEKSFVIIGDRNVIREFVTIHRATGEGEKTVIGNENLLMIHSHVPHNARIGNQVTLGGYVGISGYTVIEDQAVIGGMTGIHQFVRIGRMTMVGGHSRVVQDVPPYMLVAGSPAQVRGINSVGLQRRGVSTEAQGEIKKAFRIIYKSGLRASQIVDQLKRELKPLEEIKNIISFLEQESARGITKKLEEIELKEAEELILPEIPELGI